MAFESIIGVTRTYLVVVSYYETSHIKMINSSNFKYFVKNEWRT